MAKFFRGWILWACLNHARSIRFKRDSDGILVIAVDGEGRKHMQLTPWPDFADFAALVERESSGLAAVCWLAKVTKDCIMCEPCDPAVSGSHEEWQKLQAANA